MTEINAFEKSDDFQTAFGNGIIATEGDQWRRQRDVLQPFFTRKQVAEYSDQMVEATQRRVDTWLDREILDIEDSSLSQVRSVSLPLWLAEDFIYRSP
ncbi:hypothetical protein [Haladaptatus pallidirubidus]|uniref:hypothetical protein n=1 Tax=Haladaptatus pallidirubidus TaxID=1008152 RepID=UPI0031EF10A0